MIIVLMNCYELLGLDQHLLSKKIVSKLKVSVIRQFDVKKNVLRMRAHLSAYRVLCGSSLKFICQKSAGNSISVELKVIIITSSSFCTLECKQTFTIFLFR